MTEIMPSLQNLINLSYDPAGNGVGLVFTKIKNRLLEKDCKYDQNIPPLLPL